MSKDDTKQVYERAGFGKRTQWGKRPALLIVDFCYGMTDPASPLGSDMGAAIWATGQVLKVMRQKHLPVAFTTVRYTKGAQDGGAFVRKIQALRVFEEGVEGGRWSEIDARLEPLPTESIIIKKFASAFFGTNLASLFTSERVDSVIVTGSTTSGCVRASALDALQNGFSVIVPRDCVADRAQGPHESNLFDLNAKYADVVSLEETLAYLDGI